SANFRRGGAKGRVRRSDSVGAGVFAAVDQPALAGNVAGQVGGQVRDQRADFVGAAETAGGVGRHAGLADFLVRAPGGLGQLFDVALLRAGVEGARQYIVDGDIVADGLARQAAHEADQAGARAVRQ